MSAMYQLLCSNLTSFHSDWSTDSVTATTSMQGWTLQTTDIWRRYAANNTQCKHILYHHCKDNQPQTEAVEVVARKLIQRHCHVAGGCDLARQLMVAQRHTCHSMLQGHLSTPPVASHVTTLHTHIQQLSLMPCSLIKCPSSTEFILARLHPTRHPAPHVYNWNTHHHS